MRGTGTLQLIVEGVISIEWLIKYLRAVRTCTCTCPVLGEKRGKGNKEANRVGGDFFSPI